MITGPATRIMNLKSINKINGVYIKKPQYLRLFYYKQITGNLFDQHKLLGLNIFS